MGFPTLPARSFHEYLIINTFPLKDVLSFYMQRVNVERINLPESQSGSSEDFLCCLSVIFLFLHENQQFGAK